MSSCWYHCGFHRGWERAQERHFLSLSWIVQRQTCLKLNWNTFPLVIMTVATCCLIEPFSLRTCYMWGYLVGHYPILWLQRGTYKTRLFRDLKNTVIVLCFFPTYIRCAPWHAWVGLRGYWRTEGPSSRSIAAFSQVKPWASVNGCWYLSLSMEHCACKGKMIPEYGVCCHRLCPLQSFSFPQEKLGVGDCWFHDVL